jgi:hypothetical protein
MVISDPDADRQKVSDPAGSGSTTLVLSMLSSYEKYISGVSGPDIIYVDKRGLMKIV